jgi:hypothetical protein
VRGLREILGAAFAVLAGAEVVCAGQVTAAAARAAGLPVHLVAADPTARGVAEALARDRSRRVEEQREPAVVATVGGFAAGTGAGRGDG